MSITYLPQYGFYSVEIGPLTIFDRDRKAAIHRVLTWFTTLYGDHA